MFWMQRLRKAGLGLKLMAAFLILFGTSSAAFTSMLCATDKDAPCPLKAKAKAEAEAKTSCCPGMAQDSAKAEDGGGCCCKISQKPSVPATTAPVVVPASLVVLILPFQIILPEAGVTSDPAAISFYSGSSPPIVARGPDSSRAPPVA